MDLLVFVNLLSQKQHLRPLAYYATLKSTSSQLITQPYQCDGICLPNLTDMTQLEHCSQTHCCTIFQRAVERSCLKLLEQFSKFHHLVGSDTDVDPTQPGEIIYQA